MNASSSHLLKTATALALGLALGACSKGPAPAAAAAPATGASPATEGVTSVRVVTAEKVMRAGAEELTGALAPGKALHLGFEVGGTLRTLHVKKGDKVKQGQLLAQLDAEIADAQVAQARANLLSAEAAALLATDMAQRNERLQQKGTISDAQSRSATTQSKQAEAGLLAAKATLAQAQAARRRHALKAPFDATVVDAPEQLGGTVGPGMPLFVLEQLDTLVMKTTLAEAHRAKVQVGTKLAVSSVSANVTTDAATVRVLLPSADRATRRIPVEIEVPNPDGRFVAHTLARALLPLGEPGEAYKLPATALSSAGGDHVFIAEGDTARRVPVQVLERGANIVFVRADRPLQRVIDYPGTVVDGARVKERSDAAQ